MENRGDRAGQPEPCEGNTIKQGKKKHRKRPPKRRNVKPELLAPAGSKEAFHAAIENGADAVYVSPRILNARAYGRNFSLEEIAALADTAHGMGRKILVALNSLMKQEEISEAVRLLAALDEIKVDALIIQDLGIWRICRRHFPGLKLHASTLMNIHNSAGVNQAERMGFSRVVLARELTLREMAFISRSTSIELEVFIHGAMCFTMSGLCMFSSYFGGRSSTRGKCVQPCRRRFTWDGVPGTFFSMDDLCGLEAVPDLARMGISSLKIEGRLKPPDYIASVTKAYRMVLDADSKSFTQVAGRARRILHRAMGRPLSPGFFYSQNPRSAISPTRTANTGLYMGKITGMRKGRLELSGPVIPCPGDMLRLVITRKDIQFSTRCTDVKALGKNRSVLELEGRHEDLPANLSGALVFRTSSKNKDSKKTGKKQGRVPSAGRESIPAKVEKRAAGILGRISQDRTDRRTDYDPNNRKKTGRPEIFLKLSSGVDLKIAGGLDIKGVILEISQTNIRSVSRGMPARISREQIIWALPPVVFQKDLSALERQVDALLRLGFRNFQVSNLSHLALFRKARGRRPAHLFSSYQLNILNSEAVRAAMELGVRECHFSIETDMGNMKQALSACRPGIIFTVFGFIPLFTSRLRHRIYDGRAPVKSTRGEEYFWQASGDTGRLFPKTPFSALDMREKLMEAGATKWILDFSNMPGKSRLPRRLPSSVRSLATRLRGRSFNLKKELD